MTWVVAVLWLGAPLAASFCAGLLGDPRWRGRAPIGLGVACVAIFVALLLTSSGVDPGIAAGGLAVYAFVVAVLLGISFVAGALLRRAPAPVQVIVGGLVVVAAAVAHFYAALIVGLSVACSGSEPCD